MAIQHFTTGPALIEFDSNILGYAEDRVQQIIVPSWEDIHSDDFGGLAGPPSDAQLLGARVIVQMVMTKYDRTLLDALSSFDQAGAAGILPAVGEFVRLDSLYAALVISGRNETRTYDVAFLRQNQELNSSARHRRYGLGFECWIDAACTRELMVIAAGRNPCSGDYANLP
jgi:hypothetical protein